MGSWVFDDPNIVDDEMLFRRVRRIPDQVLEDPLTGNREPKFGAFKVDDDSGMSIYLERFLASNDLGVRDLYTDGKEHLASFRVAATRGVGWGVVVEEGNEAHPRRLAHGLVRAQNPRPTRTMKRELREALIASCSWACAC